MRAHALAAAAAMTAAMIVQASSSPVMATGSEGFLFLQPGFTQLLWATNPSFLGGVAFAKNGDVLTDHCQFDTSPLDDYSQTSTTMVHGSTIHNFTELPSSAGCGLTNHPNGSIYTNTSGGVRRLDGATGAPIAGPFGHAGNALGIATDPVTGNLIYVGDDQNLYFVDPNFTSQGTFSTASPGAFKDQITWSPDGKFLFASHRSPFFSLEIIDRAGALVQDAVMTHEPDGIAFHAVAPQFVVTNDTDGTMTRFDFPLNDYTKPPAQTLFASGGFRGDMTAVGSDGCLYITQAGTRYADGFTDGNNSVLQICGGFAPPPGVGDAPIAGHPVTITTTEGQSFTGTVATVTDGDPNDKAAEYKATIDWGDGSPVEPGVVSGSDGGPYNVTGTHTYTEEGTYTILVHVTDSDSSNTADAKSTANVGDAALDTPVCEVPPVIVQDFAGATGSFTDANSFAASSDFTASIDWGDGSSSVGTVTGASSGPYEVTGSHTYSSTGSVVITTTVKDDGGKSITITCKTVVAAFPTPQGGTFVVGDLEAKAPPMIGNHLTWWGSQWAQVNQMSGGPAPSSMKGFAGFEDMPLPSPLPPLTKLCGMTWTTDTGNSTPPPATVPSDMLVIVSSHIVQNGSVISGDIVEVIVVHNDPGYQPDPGHPGTGTEEAVVCSSP